MDEYILVNFSLGVLRATVEYVAYVGPKSPSHELVEGVFFPSPSRAYPHPLSRRPTKLRALHPGEVYFHMVSEPPVAAPVTDLAVATVVPVAT